MGLETFLYSQHWQLAAVVLVSGVMAAGAWARLRTAVLAVLTSAVAAQNLLHLRGMLAVLPEALR